MAKNFNLQAILFDLDGTLLDTAYELYFALNKLLDENNKPLADIKQLKLLISHGSEAIVKYYFNDNQNLLHKLTNRYREIYFDNLGNNCKMFDGIADLLKYIKANNYQWAIVTNKLEKYTYPLIKNIINKLQLNYNPVIVCKDTVKNPKPHPEPILYACNKLKINPKNALMIGDSSYDIEAGLRAETKTILVKYGYLDIDNFNKKNLSPHFTIEHPHEIKKIIELF